MCFILGQFVWVWSGEVHRGQRAVDVQYFIGFSNLQEYGTDGGKECKV